MLTWKRLGWVLAFELASGVSWAQSHHHHCIGTRGGIAGVPGVAGGLGAGTPFPFYSSIDSNGMPFIYAPTPLLVPVFGPGVNPPTTTAAGGGVAGPWPEFLPIPPQVPAAGEAAKPRRSDPTRSGQLVTIGDRLFRAGNLHKAADRYEQAMNADPRAAAPRVRLAQVAVVRGQYSEAANRYREALTSEPGWLINAPDIQAVYGEPSDFARQIARLESHLHTQPNDRDAWLVLGAQWYLSGQSRKASDVFLRLSDRQGDATLAAFLDASTPRRADAQ